MTSTTQAASITLLLAFTPGAFADGNVEGSVKKGALILKGDGDANDIEVIGVGYDTIKVRGRSGTTINGKLSKTFDHVDGDVAIKLGDGDDEVEVRYLTVREDLRIRGELGDDVIVLFDNWVQDDLKILGGGGEDEIIVDETWVWDDSAIKGGKKRDDVHIDDSFFDGDFVFRGGNGDDELIVTTCDFDDEALFHMGNGDDEQFIGTGTWFAEDVEFDGAGQTDALVFGYVYFDWGVDVEIDDYEYFSY